MLVYSLKNSLAAEWKVIGNWAGETVRSFLQGSRQELTVAAPRCDRGAGGLMWTPALWRRLDSGREEE